MHPSQRGAGARVIQIWAELAIRRRSACTHLTQRLANLIGGTATCCLRRALWARGSAQSDGTRPILSQAMELFKSVTWRWWDGGVEPSHLLMMSAQRVF